MSISPTYGYAWWVKDISLNKIILSEMLNNHLMRTTSLHHWLSFFETRHKLLQPSVDVCDALSVKCVVPQNPKEMKQA